MRKLLTITFILCVCCIPLWAIVSGRSLTNTLKELCTELKTAYQERTEAQQRFNDDYKRQHQQMIDVVTKSNELSILLYTQEQEMTFDLAYALKKVTANYKVFSINRRPYDHIVSSLNYEIDRNARLLHLLCLRASEDECQQPRYRDSRQHALSGGLSAPEGELRLCRVALSGS